MANSDPSTVARTTTVDFTNTKTAFAHKSNKALRATFLLFKFMNQPMLVKAGSAFGLWLNRTGINIFNPIIKATIFRQFCGGSSLKDSEKTVNHLRSNNTMTVLDYGAEGKTKEEEFDYTMEQNIISLQFASTHPSVPIVATKLTSLASFDLLEKYQSKKPLSLEETNAFRRVRERVDKLCSLANEKNVSLFIDAEETWIQEPIDEIVREMMKKYNRQKVVVYQTYQMYRKGKLEELMQDHRDARNGGYMLGAKVVRGAYMEKERARAIEHGYPSPIQDSKVETDADFNNAVSYCTAHHDEIAFCNATHNLASNQLLATLIDEKGLPKNHKNLSFCQLYGMSDNITFNLAAAGYNVAKIVPYGPVKEVLPYLIRRAQENTSISGEMSRELNLIVTEMERRGLK